MSDQAYKFIVGVVLFGMCLGLLLTLVMAWVGGVI